MIAWFGKFTIRLTRAVVSLRQGLDLRGAVAATEPFPAFYRAGSLHGAEMRQSLEYVAGGREAGDDAPSPAGRVASSARGF